MFSANSGEHEHVFRLFGARTKTVPRVCNGDEIKKNLQNVQRSVNRVKINHHFITRNKTTGRVVFVISNFRRSSRCDLRWKRVLPLSPYRTFSQSDVFKNWRFAVSVALDTTDTTKAYLSISRILKWLNWLNCLETVNSKTHARTSRRFIDVRVIFTRCVFRWRRRMTRHNNGDTVVLLLDSCLPRSCLENVFCTRALSIGFPWTARGVWCKIGKKTNENGALGDGEKARRYNVKYFGMFVQVIRW